MAEEPNRIELTGMFFRQVSPPHSPLWHRPLPSEPQRQEAQRYNRAGTRYVQYLASTPQAAWAEHLRQAEIRSVEDLNAVRRVLYAAWIEETDIADLSALDDTERVEPGLGEALVGDDEANFERTRDLADSLGQAGYRGLIAPSAALTGSLTLALFGPRSEHIIEQPPESEEGWRSSSRVRVMPLAKGRPPSRRILERVRYPGEPYPEGETSYRR